MGKRSSSGITNGGGTSRSFDTKSSIDEYFRGDIESVSEYTPGNRGYKIKEDPDKPATQWMNSLTEDEKASVNTYTGSAYDDINRYLRGQQPYTSYKDDISSIDGAISKFELKDDIEVYRGMYASPELLDKLQPGRIFRDDGYGSTTTLKSSAFGGNVRMEIKVRKGKGVGAYIDGLSAYEGREMEFLLARGAKYKIKSRELVNGKYVVKAEIIGFKETK